MKMNSILKLISIGSKNLFGIKSLNANICYSQIKFQSTFNICNFTTDSRPPVIDPTNVKELSAEELLTPLLKQKVHPFTLYVQKQFKDVAAKNPNTKAQNIIKMIGTSWKDMSFDEKIKYLEETETLKKKLQDKIAEVKSKFTKEEIDSVEKKLLKERVEKRKKMSTLRLKKKKKAMNKPKHPLSSFFLYIKTLDRGDASIQDFVKGASQKWKALPKQDKEVFELEQKKQSEKYQEEMKLWETKMISEGNDDLVTKPFLKNMRKKLSKKSSGGKKSKIETKGKKLKASMKKTISKPTENVKTPGKKNLIS